MYTPIFPRVIYPIGDLPEGMFYAVVSARGFDYLRDLPDLDYDEDDTITLVDSGPPTLRDEDVQDLIETERPVPWCHRAA
jgi:hypothetical protein